jgi:hypothetical protein
LYIFHAEATKKRNGLIAGLVVGLGGAAIILATAIMCKRRSTKPTNSKPDTSSNSNAGAAGDSGAKAPVDGGSFTGVNPHSRNA